MKYLNIYIYRNGRQLGSYTAESICEYLRSGKVAEDDWAWTKGLMEWVRLFDLVDIGEGQEQNAIDPRESTKEQLLD